MGFYEKWKNCGVTRHLGGRAFLRATWLLMAQSIRDAKHGEQECSPSRCACSDRLR